MDQEEKEMGALAHTDSRCSEWADLNRCNHILVLFNFFSLLFHAE